MKNMLFLLLFACNISSSNTDREEMRQFASTGEQPVFPKLSDLLKFKAPNNYFTVTVLGFNTQDDQGGGIFYWDAFSNEKPDNGTIFESSVGNSKGRWKRVYSGPINVKWYGANAKGALDATTAIQNAINSGHNEIYFGDASDTYLLENPLTLFNIDNIKFIGKATLLVKKNNYHLIIKGNSKKYSQHVKIEELKFAGKGKGIQSSFTEFLIISNCLFSGTGIHMSLNPNEQDIKPSIRQNIFYGSEVGILAGDTRIADCFITENYFVNNSKYAISIGYMDGGTVSYNKIFNDLPKEQSNIGILIKKPIYSNIIFNDFMELNGVALKLLAPRYCNISNNNFIKNGITTNSTSLEILPIGKIESEFNNINNNNIKDPQGVAVFLYGVNRSRFSDNNIVLNINNKTTNVTTLSIDNCSSLEITNNQVDGQNTKESWIKSQRSDIRESGNRVKGFKTN